MFKTIFWENNKVVLLDQTRLPKEEIYLTCNHYEEVAEAIYKMQIRGAPAIGVAAAMGIALGAQALDDSQGSDNFHTQFKQICSVFAKTRPTAVNLFWAINRLKNYTLEHKTLPLSELKKGLKELSCKILEDDIQINKDMGRHGKQFIKNGNAILTHCNAGALATAGYGTALGVIRSAFAEGKNIRVLADETRPFLQGARLTAWELMQDNIPVTLITDNMAGFFMKKGMIDLIIVGADRIAANGDTANKIGTYSLGVLAKENKIPFYIAAPLSTIDLATPTGDEIPIEERRPQEVTHIFDHQLAPDNVNVFNPAFDVTPNRYITAIITEKGVAYPPYDDLLKRLKGSSTS
ncbi:MAG: S-methyl-5-thioribose-1-phosphate isomerase [bacterium]